jgi:sporulation protein YlmC with PRC-barrel domain
MDLPMNATVACANGPGGHSTAIILNPVNNEITHLIVREPGLLGVERMVPVELVTESTPELIRLRCTSEELTELPPFRTTSYLPALPGFQPGYNAGRVFSPYMSMQPIGIDHANTPADERTIYRGAHVHATDGQIGAVEEFLVDPVSNAITHVVLREGHFWSRQDVTIPMAQIDHIDDDGVYLKLDKHEIEALPAVAVHRGGR